MRHLKLAANRLWASLLFFVVIFAVHGCSDTNNVSGPPAPVPLSPDAKLSSLTVNPGALQPVFSSDVARYTVDVASSVASVTVTARTQNAGATIHINNQASANLSVTLNGPGSSTTIPILVTALNGNQSTYFVIVNRGGGSNDLQGLTVSPSALAPTFTASTTSYSVDVANAVNSISVTGTLQDPNATMTINGVITNSGQARSITLNPPGPSVTVTTITIVVTAPSGSNKTYIVTVNRAALGGDNNLSALAVTGQTLSPPFAAGILSYTVNVATGVTSVTVSATKAEPNAVMSGSVTAGTGVASGQATIPLGGPGTGTPISILVTAQNGVSQKTYSVTVNRALPASDNNLSALSVTGQTLSPPFAAGTLNYTVDVATGVTSVTVSATKADPNAVMSGSVTAGTGVASGQATIPLGGPGTDTIVSITVTAPNGASKIYAITVNRAAIVLSSNNNLSALAVSSGALSPTFDAGTVNYTVTAPSTTTDTTVTATVEDSTATLTINGVSTTSGTSSASIPLVGGPNPPISVVVTAESGTQKAYTITITVEP